MESHPSEVLLSTQKFMRYECSPLSLRKKSAIMQAKDYLKEVQMHMKNLMYLENRISQSISFLEKSEKNIELLSFSSDAVTLKELVLHKLESLQDKNAEILSEILIAKERLRQQCIAVSSFISEEVKTAQSVSSNSFRPELFFGVFSLKDLATQETEMSKHILQHYNYYNRTLKELKQLAEEGSISEKDREIIYTIICPVSEKDKYPRVSSFLRCIFGARIFSAGSFFKELLRKSRTKKMRLPTHLDRMSKLFCFTHFVYNYLIFSSIFLFGTAYAVIFSMIKSFSFVMEHKYSLATITASLFFLYTFLWVWALFGMSTTLFPWMFGYSMVKEPLIEETYDDMEKRHKKELLPVYIANACSSLVLISIFIFLLKRISLCRNLTDSPFFSIVSLSFSIYVSYMNILSSLFMLKKFLRRPFSFSFSFLYSAATLLFSVFFIFFLSHTLRKETMNLFS